MPAGRAVEVAMPPKVKNYLQFLFSTYIKFNGEILEMYALIMSKYEESGHIMRQILSASRASPWTPLGAYIAPKRKFLNKSLLECINYKSLVQQYYSR